MAFTSAELKEDFAKEICAAILPEVCVCADRQVFEVVEDVRVGLGFGLVSVCVCWVGEGRMCVFFYPLYSYLPYAFRCPSFHSLS